MWGREAHIRPVRHSRQATWKNVISWSLGAGRALARPQLFPVGSPMVIGGLPRCWPLRSSGSWLFTSPANCGDAPFSGGEHGPVHCVEVER